MLVVVTTVSAFVTLFDRLRSKTCTARGSSPSVAVHFRHAGARYRQPRADGWEGSVGLASYLADRILYHKPEANAAAIKALSSIASAIRLRAGIRGVYDDRSTRHHLAQAPSLAGDHRLFGWQADALTLIACCRSWGRWASAQFLLHTWLPDAMEGPDAGLGADPCCDHGHRRVFMVARLSPLFELAPRRGLRHPGWRHRVLRRHRRSAQNDIKRIVRTRPARSSATCSSRWASAPIRSACSNCSPTPSSGRFVPRLRLGDHGDAHEQTSATWVAEEQDPFTYGAW
jgi:hypothetical protein